MKKTTALLIALLFFAASAQARGLSSVELGASVEFRRFELVKVLGQHFTVEMKEGAKASMNMSTDDKGRNIVIIH